MKGLELTEGIVERKKPLLHGCLRGIIFAFLVTKVYFCFGGQYTSNIEPLESTLCRSALLSHRQPKRAMCGCRLWKSYTRIPNAIFSNTVNQFYPTQFDPIQLHISCLLNSIQTIVSRL